MFFDDLSRCKIIENGSYHDVKSKGEPFFQCLGGMHAAMHAGILVSLWWQTMRCQTRLGVSFFLQPLIKFDGLSFSGCPAPALLLGRVKYLLLFVIIESIADLIYFGTFKTHTIVTVGLQVTNYTIVACNNTKCV